MLKRVLLLCICKRTVKRETPEVETEAVYGRSKQWGHLIWLDQILWDLVFPYISTFVWYYRGMEFIYKSFYFTFSSFVCLYLLPCNCDINFCEDCKNIMIGNEWMTNNFLILYHKILALNISPLQMFIKLTSYSPIKKGMSAPKIKTKTT